MLKNVKNRVFHEKGSILVVPPGNFRSKTEKFRNAFIFSYFGEIGLLNTGFWKNTIFSEK